MKKFENFTKALLNLEDVYNYEEPYDNVTLAGLVALYQICFEQSWKAIKEILVYNGFESATTGSPRSIIKQAYSVGMLDDEEIWLAALVARNNVAHAYNQAVAYDIVRQTKKGYVEMFKALEVQIKDKWITE